jgi:hypothetical protein
MSAARCIHTGLCKPECSCLACNREKVRRYAPHLLAEPETKVISLEPRRRRRQRELKPRVA